MAWWMGHSSAGRRNRSGGNGGRESEIGLVRSCFSESSPLGQSVGGSSLLVCLVSPRSFYDARLVRPVRGYSVHVI